ncbi:MAG: c-type cytochrome [Thermodesulfobacteriota bacterium]|nr:c-type cytochrome [Thermodesulfobacteriota bacterium]
MNYPVWYLPGIGGGLLVAIIAIVHVFISHFAVGGGLYLVFAERKGIRENSRAILEFTRSHAKFFLLMTVVAGGITGVAIWFIISLVNPGATSLLIHVFVFGWATEWVFFLVEIIAIFIYFYTFGRMDDRTHQVIGWIYFLAAWFSLFLINGIIDFMLAPGSWLENASFWSGFFNPVFWPSLLFRTAVACMFAGVYAFLTTAFLKEDEATRRSMTGFSGKWVLVSFLAAIPCGLWYFASVPLQAHGLITGGSPTIHRALQAGFWSLVVLVVLTLVLVISKPARLSRPLALFVFLSAFVFMGAFEWSREAARRPYVINGLMYSNGILQADVPMLQRSGFLPSARWTTQKELHEESLMDAGRELFIFQCYACHTIGGANNDILARTKSMSYPAMRGYLRTIHEKRYFMPPFAGNDAEARALAVFIVKGLQGKEITEVAGIPGGEGRALFESECAACHEAEHIRSLTAGWDRARIRKGLDKLSALNPEMPDFSGSDAEKDLLADFVVSLNRPPEGASAAGHDHGEEVFEENCSMCHTLRGGDNPLLPKLAGWDRQRIRHALDMLDKLRGGIMPPLKAPPADKDALTAFLVAELQGGSK